MSESPPTLESLPTELLQKILSHCSKRTAIAARGTCKVLAWAGARSALSTFDLSPFPRSVRNLHSLALSPQAHHLRTLRVNTLRIPLLWRTQFDRLLGPSRGGIPETHLPAAFELHRLYHRAQTGFEAPESVALLREALASLPRLEGVEFGHYGGYFRRDWHIPTQRGERFLGYLARRLMIYLGEAGPEHWLVGELLCDPIRPPRSPLRKLTLWMTDPSLVLLLERRFAGLADLRVLELRFRRNVFPLMKHEELLAAKRFMLRCEGLRVLRVHCNRAYHNSRRPDQGHRVPISETLAEGNWKELRKIELGANLRANEFLRFMENHGERLEILGLEEVGFDDSIAVFEGIARLTKVLMRVECHKIWPWNSKRGAYYFPTGLDEKTREWFLRGTGDVPEWTLVEVNWEVEDGDDDTEDEEWWVEPMIEDTVEEQWDVEIDEEDTEKGRGLVFDDIYR